MINKIKNRSEKWKFIISKQGLKVYDVWTRTQQVNNKNKLQLAVAGCKPLLQTKPSKNFQNVHFLTNGNTDFVQAVSAVYSDLQRQMIKIKFTNTLNYQNIYDNWIGILEFFDHYRIEIGKYSRLCREFDLRMYWSFSENNRKWSKYPAYECSACFLTYETYYDCLLQPRSPFRLSYFLL